MSSSVPSDLKPKDLNNICNLLKPNKDDLDNKPSNEDDLDIFLEKDIPKEDGAQGLH
jgi:hypothetical protein